MKFIISIIFLSFISCNYIDKPKEVIMDESVINENPLETFVIRTNFSDELKWKQLCEKIIIPQTEQSFIPNVNFISDKQYKDLNVAEVIKSLPKNYIESFVFIADSVALVHKDNPVICVDLYAEKVTTFRVIPSEMWGIENNLRIANMDFYEFADNVGIDGIFRGFKRPK